MMALMLLFLAGLLVIVGLLVYAAVMGLRRK